MSLRRKGDDEGLEDDIFNVAVYVERSGIFHCRFWKNSGSIYNSIITDYLTQNDGNAE